ncbi:phosphotransferase family protein [Pseudonocardia sp. NPDC049154]|uniref:phosphotransferase family protein n=1 Tax=Pseudonocardia sp. NPDC049154 TaxID=3155501 RepID=UPI0033CDC6F8
MARSVADQQEDAEDVGARLERFVRDRVGGAGHVRLTGLTRTSGGLSRENWVFRAAWTDAKGTHDQPLIMRRDPAGSLLDTDRREEFAVLRALEATDVAAPRAFWLDEDGSVLGSPSLVMERVEGECDWFVLNSARPEPVRLGFARGFLEMLVRIQQVDWRVLGLDAVLKDPGPDAAASELDRWEGELRRVALEPVPELEVVLRWLRERARPATRIVLVHGDFKPGNALLLGDGISAMLDWETAHLGDPLEDLGWITNPVRAREHQITGVWERERIVEVYTELTGHAVDPDELTWWNVFSCWKLAVIVLTGMHEFVAGRFDRVHHSPTWLVRAMLRMIEEGAR